MRWGWASLIAMLAGCFDGGCLDRAIVACDDGTACPATYVCRAGGGCASPAQLEACAGIADGESCFVADLGYGACVDRTCIVRICGNGRIEPGEPCDDGNDLSGDGCNATCTSTGECGNDLTDPGEECDGQADCRSDCKIARCGNALPDEGEVCDDGNLVAGDGCTPDCASDESCGNGVLDFFADEICEDSNTLDHDGCDKTCRPELLQWHQIDPLLNGVGSAMVEDGHRGRLLLFGGSREFSGLHDETWVWEGTQWRRLFPRTSPPVRFRHAMAYDSARRRIVLFGGITTGVMPIGDTWEFDGATWVQRLPAHAPSARGDHAMTYDAARKQVVLVGGDADDATWLWDGTDWTQAQPTTTPPARRNTAVTYDVDRQLVVMYGGTTVAPVTMLDDLWLWNGIDWTAVPKSGTWPSPRVGHAMAYDRGRRKSLLIAGSINPTGSVVTAVHGLDANGWVALPSMTGACTVTNFNPPPETLTRPCDRWFHTAAYHAARASTIVFGGNFGAAYYRDVLELTSTASSWSLLPVAQKPPVRGTGAAMVYDSLNAMTILFGGMDTDGLDLDQTWRWDGAGWVQVQTVSRPNERFDHALAEDPLRGQLLLNAGQNINDGPLFDTWVFKNGDWTDLQIDVADSPGYRWTHAAGQSPTRDVLVFGGLDNQTWSWTGAWSEESPATMPTNGAAPKLALDARRGRTVLVGPNTTMEWNGVTWLSASALPVNPGRGGHTLVYDPLRGETVLHGGAIFATVYGDTWAWNGSAWTERTPGGGDPGERGSHVMAYDAARGEALMYGGYTSSGGGTNLGDTWVLRWDGVGVPEACHSGHDLDGDGDVGCADTECWPWCNPMCPPGAATCDTAWPHCGDGTCSAIESYRACPSDCSIVPICGDYHCDPGETCAGDCP